MQDCEEYQTVCVEMPHSDRPQRHSEAGKPTTESGMVEATSQDGPGYFSNSPMRAVPLPQLHKRDYCPSHL